MFEFKGMRDIDVCSLGLNVLGIPQRSMALVLSLSSYAGHPRIPPGGDTVATSGFPRLPLCFTRVIGGQQNSAFVDLLLSRVCSRSDEVHLRLFWFRRG
jgi:hypothetical protein